MSAMTDNEIRSAIQAGFCMENVECEWLAKGEKPPCTDLLAGMEGSPHPCGEYCASVVEPIFKNLEPLRSDLSAAEGEWERLAHIDKEAGYIRRQVAANTGKKGGLSEFWKGAAATLRAMHLDSEAQARAAKGE